MGAIMANKNTATVERNAEQVEGQVETTEGVQENQVEGQVESAEQAPKPNPDLTPYEAAKVITAAVRKRHPERSDFTMQPQTMYGLAKRDVIATTEKPGSKADGKSKIYFKGDAFARWLKGYLSGASVGQGTRNTDYNALADIYTQGILDEAVAQGVQDEREPQDTVPQVDSEAREAELAAAEAE